MDSLSYSLPLSCFPSLAFPIFILMISLLYLGYSTASPSFPMRLQKKLWNPSRVKLNSSTICSSCVFPSTPRSLCLLFACIFALSCLLLFILSHLHLIHTHSCTHLHAYPHALAFPPDKLQQNIIYLRPLMSTALKVIRQT